MSAFALTPAGDLDFSTGSLRVVSDQGTQCAQKLAVRFKFWKGEWFLDRTQGFPYLDFVLGVKNPDMSLVRSLFNQMLLDCPFVASVDSLTLTFDRPNRALAYTFQVSMQDGSTVTGDNTDQPFIVAAP